MVELVYDDVVSDRPRAVAAASQSDCVVMTVVQVADAGDPVVVM